MTGGGERDRCLCFELGASKKEGFLPVVAVGNQLTVLDWRP